MSKTLAPKEQFWLEQFFSGRNALHWVAIANRSAPSAWLEQVEPWIEAFAAQGEGAAIVLPVFDVDGPCQWYGMTSDARSAAMLAQELTATVGPSYSDFRGQSLNASACDSIECALDARFGRFVFRLTPIHSADRHNIAQALHLYLSLRRHRPAIPDRTQRPFGRIRADFDRALLVGNEVDAQSLREELVGTGRLNAEQQKYLEIRLLAGLGRQQQLAHDYTLIRSILELSPPTQVLADIVEALYATYISPVEADPDFQTTVAIFRKHILQAFGPLFRERKGLRSLEVLKAFLLYELAQVQPDITRCDDIIANYTLEGPGRELVLRWRASVVADVPLPESVDLRDSANKALGDENYEAALELCFIALPEPFAYSGLLRCAVELADDETIGRVLEAIAAASEAARNAWTKRDLARLQQLQQIPAPAATRIRPETDWLSWTAYVQAGNYDRPPLQILEDAVARWSVDSYASDPQVCRQLADSIGNASGEAEQVFRNAFAHFAEFFADRQAHSVRCFIPIYLMLIRAVAWNGAVSANELELASGLMQALIDAGPVTQDYTEALDAYAEILSANNAPSNIDWALNAAEMLALNASPDKESRLRFFLAVVNMAREHAHRLNAVHRAMLPLLAQDYACPDLLDAFPTAQETETPEENAKQKRFAGLIGIYTLTETAAFRARQFLRNLLPNARVEINSDKASTDRLKHLASSSDIFVFAWKSSKHQAYYAAKDARGERETLLPLGKGSASILECVLGELARIG
jgi:hypothetical protein